MEERSALLSWLLDAETPSIRYLALRQLAGRPEEDLRVRAAWEGIQSSGPVPAILAGQTAAGGWAGERSYYTPKYTSTHWSMLLLAELAADGADPRYRRGVEFMLAATAEELAGEMARGAHGMSCFWGNLLRYALHGGFSGDRRVQDVVRYLVRDGLEGSWGCPINGDLACAWGAARALWGLAALPSAQNSPQVAAGIESGLGFLLREHSLVEAAYPTPGKVHPLWFRLNWPLFYQADILFVLRVLGELGALDRPEAGPALEWLAGRRLGNGRWRGSSPYRRRTWAGLAAGSEIDRWASLQAAAVLQGAAEGSV